MAAATESTSRDAAITVSVMCWRSDSSSRDRPGAAPPSFAAVKEESFSMSDSAPMIRAICRAFGESLGCSPSLPPVSATRGLASAATRWLSWAGHVVNRTKRSPETARAQRTTDLRTSIATFASFNYVCDNAELFDEIHAHDQWYSVAIVDVKSS